MGLVVGVFFGFGGIVGLFFLLLFMFGMELVYGFVLMIGMVVVVLILDIFVLVLMGIFGFLVL